MSARCGPGQDRAACPTPSAGTGRRVSWQCHLWGRRALLAALHGDSDRAEMLAEEASWIATRTAWSGGQRTVAHVRSLVAMVHGNLRQARAYTIAAGTADHPVGHAVVLAAGALRARRLGQQPLALSLLDKLSLWLEQVAAPETPGTAEALAHLLCREGLPLPSARR